MIVLALFAVIGLALLVGGAVLIVKADSFPLWIVGTVAVLSGIGILLGTAVHG